MSALPPPDLSPEDLDAVSAYVDGEATLAEAARVEGSPQLRALADQFRVVVAAVAAPVPPPPAAARQAAIERAVLAADEQGTVTSLADARARRSAARRWLPALTAAAAALLLVALVPAMLRSSDEPQTLAVPSTATGETLSASAEDSAQSADAAGTATGGAASSGGGLDMTTRDADLGQYDDLGILTSEVRDRFNARTEAAAPPSAAPSTTFAAASTPAGPACDGSARATDSALGALLYDAPATFRDAPVHVFVFELSVSGPVSYRLVVVTADCAVLTTDDF